MRLCLVFCVRQRAPPHQRDVFRQCLRAILQIKDLQQHTISGSQKLEQPWLCNQKQVCFDCVINWTRQGRIQQHGLLLGVFVCESNHSRSFDTTLSTSGTSVRWTLLSCWLPQPTACFSMSHISIFVFPHHDTYILMVCFFLGVSWKCNNFGCFRKFKSFQKKKVVSWNSALDPGPSPS